MKGFISRCQYRTRGWFVTRWHCIMTWNFSSPGFFHRRSIFDRTEIQETLTGALYLLVAVSNLRFFTCVFAYRSFAAVAACASLLISGVCFLSGSFSPWVVCTAAGKKRWISVPLLFFPAIFGADLWIRRLYDSRVCFLQEESLLSLILRPSSSA
jgi:hypothetical protein